MLIKRLIITILILFIPSIIFANPKDLIVGDISRLTHDAYRIAAQQYGLKGAEPYWNLDGTKIIYLESTTFTHPTYTETGRGWVWALMSDLKDLSDLADWPSGASNLTSYQNVTNVFDDHVHLTSNPAICWSRLTGEDDIVYRTLYSGSNCTQLQKWDTSDVGPSWANVIDVSVGTTECRNMAILGFTANDDLIVMLENDDFTYSFSGQRGWRISDVGGTPSKASITSWPTAGCSSDYVSDSWKLDFRTHGHSFSNPDFTYYGDYWANAANPYSVVDIDACVQYDTDTVRGPFGTSHGVWNVDLDWFLADEGHGTGGDSAPNLNLYGIYQVYYDPAGAGTFTYRVLLEKNSAGGWKDNGTEELNFSAHPLPIMKTDGTEVLFTSTDGAYSYDDFVYDNGLSWDTEGLFLMEVSIATTSVLSGTFIGSFQ